MTAEDQVSMQRQLTNNVLDDPNATKEAKLIALMSSRQLDIHELVLHVGDEHKKLEGRVSSLEQAGLPHPVQHA